MPQVTIEDMPQVTIDNEVYSDTSKETKQQLEQVEDVVKDKKTEDNCLNLKKVDTFGNNTKSKNETKDTDTTSVQ